MYIYNIVHLVLISNILKRKLLIFVNSIEERKANNMNKIKVPSKIRLNSFYLIRYVRNLL